MGDLLGLSVGVDVVGDLLGLSVGEDVVGDLLGLSVGVDVVGDLLGLSVGLSVGVQVVTAHHGPVRPVGLFVLGHPEKVNMLEASTA